MAKIITHGKRYLVVPVIFITVLIGSQVVASCRIRKGEPITQKSFVPANERIANGEKLYMAHCQKCHPGGEAGLGPGINANPAPQMIKRFQMRHGLGVMPSFTKKEISRKDLHDISKYLRAWKHY